MVNTTARMFSRRDWMPEVNVTVARAIWPWSPPSCWTSPITADGSLLVMPVMSGDPSALATISKPTVVVVPVPKTSPLQPPVPAMSVSAPAVTPVFSAPCLVTTRTLPVAASFTNVTWFECTFVAVSPSAGLTATPASEPLGVVETSTVSGTPKRGSVVVLVSAVTAGASTAGAVVVSVVSVAGSVADAGEAMRAIAPPPSSIALTAAAQVLRQYKSLTPASPVLARNR